MKIIIDGKTVDIGEVCASGEVYSTEEVRTGTWIDGKPLYRMVIPDIDVKNEGNVNTVIYEVPSSEMYIVSHEEHTAPKKYPTEKQIGNFYIYETSQSAGVLILDTHTGQIKASSEAQGEDEYQDIAQAVSIPHAPPCRFPGLLSLTPAHHTSPNFWAKR